MRILYRGAMICVIVLASSVASAYMKFDFGTDNSPLSPGYKGVTGESVYSSDKGYGWDTTGQSGFVAKTPEPLQQRPSMTLRGHEIFRENVTPLLADGIHSENDMTFRIDVPDGEYKVSVTVGDLENPLGSMWVECNGKTVAHDVNAIHYAGRFVPNHMGFYRLVRFTARSKAGALRIRFFGDDKKYKADREHHEKTFKVHKFGWKLEGVPSYLHKKFNGDNGWDVDNLPFDAGRPFERNSVLSLEVRPGLMPLLGWKGAEMYANEMKADVFADAVNRRDFLEAESIIDAAIETKPFECGMAYLFLMGHPDSPKDREKYWIEEARNLLEPYSSDPIASEYLEDLTEFARARDDFVRRGDKNRNHFSYSNRVIARMALINPDSPLYHKAQLYLGRALLMACPHRRCYPAGEATKLFREFEELWPDNKYVRLFLYDEWKQDSDWHHREHMDGSEGAPEWAVELRRAYGLVIDMCEWWADNKQYEYGGIGGGSGDDVELVGLWATMGYISPDQSPKTLAVADKLITWIWFSTALDPKSGFCRPMADAEHTAEWSGDTLQIMVKIKHGDPLWLERAMMTSKLMRSLWLAKSDLGHLHFQANYFAATRVSGGPHANDSYINYRATRPAEAVYAYNRNPVIGKLFADWAAAWAADAMRTDRNKPKGVFPADIGFPEDILGGVSSENWYTGHKPAGTVNHDFATQNYKGYIVQLMMRAYDVTGDEKYLEPLRLEAELAQRYLDNPVENPEPGSAEWAGMILSAETEKNKGTALETLENIEKRLGDAKSDGPGVLYSAKDVIEHSQYVTEMMTRWWPTLTTEASATDRVAFHGIVDPYFLMCGSPGHGDVWNNAVTYEGVGHNATAYVNVADEQNLKVVLYNFNTEPIDAAIFPWRLDTGGTYTMSVGVDSRDDATIDKEIETRSINLERHGIRIPVRLAPRQTTIVELKQTKTGRGGRLLPDMAVAASEIAYDTKWSELEVTVHNIGSLEAENVVVRVSEVSDSGDAQLLGNSKIPYMTWPMNLEPATMRVGIHYAPKKASTKIRVEVDPGNKIEEITTANNVVETHLVLTQDQMSELAKPQQERKRTW